METRRYDRLISDGPFRPALLCSGVDSRRTVVVLFIAGSTQRTKPNLRLAYACGGNDACCRIDCQCRLEAFKGLASAGKHSPFLFK